jgi:murein DD-endopeptidase MepM/ murein hydrolase activator NlpD
LDGHEEIDVHLIITDAWLAKSRALHLSGLKLAMVFAAGALALVLLSLGLYHMVFLKGVREGWPVVGSVAKLVANKNDSVQRERYLRENLDAMATRLGEMQARMVQLEALGERVSGLAGISPAEIKAAQSAPARGGALISAHSLTMDELNAALAELELLTNQRVDLLTVVESRLVDQKIKTSMVPTQEPAPGSRRGSDFGFRIDPITGRQALHTGQDYPGDVGTTIVAAAGGVVVRQEEHPAYGNMVEINHGNELSTLYAHASKVVVKQGDLIKRGQKIAEIGSTGRSTGPHLHFEVLVQGVPQDPQAFLDAGQKLVDVAAAGSKSGRAAKVK